MLNCILRYPEIEFTDDDDSGTKHVTLVNLWSVNVDEAIEASAKNNVFSFMISRNPYERILSAYRDFYEEISDDGYIKEFLKMKKTDKLTFKYFVEYLVDLPIHLYNFHWVPMYLQCRPCQMNYDILGRMESLAEDSKKILSRLGLNNSLAHDHQTQGGSSRANLLKYYSEINPNLMEKLYKLYEMDFILFDYDRNLTVAT